jgi:hypothetical protein
VETSVCCARRCGKHKKMLQQFQSSLIVYFLVRNDDLSRQARDAHSVEF